MNGRVKFILFFVSLVILLDMFFPKKLMETSIHKRTFIEKNGNRVYYGIPYTGGGMGNCEVEDITAFELGEPLVVEKSIIFRRCKVNINHAAKDGPGPGG